MQHFQTLQEQTRSGIQYLAVLEPVERQAASFSRSVGFHVHLLRKMSMREPSHTCKEQSQALHPEFAPQPQVACNIRRLLGYCTVIQTKHLRQGLLAFQSPNH